MSCTDPRFAESMRRAGAPRHDDVQSPWTYEQCVAVAASWRGVAALANAVVEGARAGWRTWVSAAVCLDCAWVGESGARESAMREAAAHEC